MNPCGDLTAYLFFTRSHQGRNKSHQLFRVAQRRYKSKKFTLTSYMGKRETIHAEVLTNHLLEPSQLTDPDRVLILNTRTRSIQRSVFIQSSMVKPAGFTYHGETLTYGSLFELVSYVVAIYSSSKDAKLVFLNKCLNGMQCRSTEDASKKQEAQAWEQFWRDFSIEYWRNTSGYFEPLPAILTLLRQDNTENNTQEASVDLLSSIHQWILVNLWKLQFMEEKLFRKLPWSQQQKFRRMRLRSQIKEIRTKKSDESSINFLVREIFVDTELQFYYVHMGVIVLNSKFGTLALMMRKKNRTQTTVKIILLPGYMISSPVKLLIDERHQLLRLVYASTSTICVMTITYRYGCKVQRSLVKVGYKEQAGKSPQFCVATHPDTPDKSSILICRRDPINVLKVTKMTFSQTPHLGSHFTASEVFEKQLDNVSRMDRKELISCREAFGGVLYYYAVFLRPRVRQSLLQTQRFS